MSNSELKPYPIEFDFPDISEFAKGNGGIPYTYTFDSGVPGSHVMICALTHGNEVCGAVVLKELIEAQFTPERGKVSLCFSNVDAYLSFDKANPDKSRFVDQDLNRVWREEFLADGSRQTSELKRARQLKPLIDSVDFLLDIHSMHEKSLPLIVSGPLEKGIELAKQLGAPTHIIVDKGHKDGTRMRDYGAFADPNSDKNAILVECGQHWEASSLTVARDTVVRFLMQSKVIDDLAELQSWLQPTQGDSSVINVTEPVVAKSMSFKFVENYTGLELFAEKDTLIGWNDDQEVRTPYDHCVLVMPSLRQLLPGVTVVRLGQLVT